jgi:SAM-dependent methyltransferase
MLHYSPATGGHVSTMDKLSIARRVQCMLPAAFELPARLAYLRMRGWLYGGQSVHCSCCQGRFSRFLDVGSPPRPAACPGCDSRERQRLLITYLRERTDLFSKQLRVLHFAPEDCLQPLFSRMPNLDYLSADVASRTAMVRMDITRIPEPDDSFDAILCSHVLEHVTDDRAAMRELCRVLRPGGWAILQVPVDSSRQETFEDPAITDPGERTRLFGQHDHVRMYGRDYPQRLEECGFEVMIVPYPEQLGAAAVHECGLDVEERIHHCRKPG